MRSAPSGLGHAGNVARVDAARLEGDDLVDGEVAVAGGDRGRRGSRPCGAAAGALQGASAASGASGASGCCGRPRALRGLRRPRRLVAPVEVLGDGEERGVWEKASPAAIRATQAKPSLTREVLAKNWRARRSRSTRSPRCEARLAIRKRGPADCGAAQLEESGEAGGVGSGGARGRTARRCRRRTRSRRRRR